MSGNVYAEDIAWKIKDKYMKPECLANDTANDLYLWQSFDNYQEYYEKYIGIKDFDQWKDEKNSIGLVILSKNYETYNKLPKTFFKTIEDWKKENNLDQRPAKIEFVGKNDNVQKIK